MTARNEEEAMAADGTNDGLLDVAVIGGSQAGLAPQPLGHRDYPQVEGVAVSQLKQRWPGRLGQPGRIGREGLGPRRLARLRVLLHDQYLVCRVVVIQM